MNGLFTDKFRVVWKMIESEAARAFGAGVRGTLNPETFHSE